METSFKNLDNDYRKVRREYIGDIQPKFWYRGDNDLVLVKRQASQSIGRNKPRSKMYNHIGEYFGYLLAKQASVKVCPVDLVILHDTKNKYSKTIKLFKGCASHSLKKPETTIVPGEIILDSFNIDDFSKYKELFSSQYISDTKSIYDIFSEDNIDLIIASIIKNTIDIEQRIGKRNEEEIKCDVKENVQDMIDMVVYDCIFGNHDRHSGNWSMEIDPKTGRARLYSLYDNEAVLGLRRTVAEIENIVNYSDNLEESTNNTLFSRMSINPRVTNTSYKDMLDYLFKKYPEYAISSIGKITSRVDEEFVSNLYDSVRGISKRGEFVEELTDKDELPEVYRIFGMQAFRFRRQYAIELLQKTKSREEVDLSH